MADRREFLSTLTASGIAATTLNNIPNNLQVDAKTSRAYWIDVLTRIADPVLQSLANQSLKEKMPVECITGDPNERRKYTYLEAFGRLLAGISPWLELGDDGTSEGKLRAKYAELARKCMANAVDPASKDFMNFNTGSQPVVDAAFLAHAIVRAPNELWVKLDQKTKTNLIAALKSSRSIKPYFNNWLLFSGMVEAALCVMGEQWDAMRVDYAVRQHEQWYKGDGIYGDGPDFHWDYYNSFVIQPMMIDVLGVVSKKSRGWDEQYNRAMNRAVRYASIQERLISPDGTFPPIGRSLVYRFGAFQLLAQISLIEKLSADIAPPQVRCALTSVIRKMIEAPNTFDSNGWLTIGFCGHQPHLGEGYISTGSLYLCSTGLLSLGLPANNSFWTLPDSDWTAKKIWGGMDMKADKALSM